MKNIIRTLLVWVLLLALPFQAFAAASMLPHGAPAPVQPACHQQMAMKTDGKAQDHHAGQPAKAKCGGAACCVGAAPAPGLPALPAPAPARTALIPFRAGHLPSVDPVLPERPPSPFLA